jgi:hypothetical protein
MCHDQRIGPGELALQFGQVGDAPDGELFRVTPL